MHKNTLLKKRFNILAVLITMTLVYSWGCKEKYYLPRTLIDKNYLVVEGFINNGSAVTSIQLSRTVALGDTAYRKPETNANVFITGENGEQFPLNESAVGTYTGGPFLLNPITKYQLHIFTSDQKQYTSTALTVKSTPAIDSVNWTQNNDGVQIYVNTHDNSSQSRYYAWQFEETWEFTSLTVSGFKYNKEDITLVPRNDPDSIFTCWQSRASSNILIGSSAKLNSDIIYMAPITAIEKGSWKLGVRYSILVKQRVLDQETFEYLEKMRKNSEQLGSIFDPLPSTSGGNVKCTSDPSEIVIGQVYISSIAEQRIFINHSQLEKWGFYFTCKIDTVPNDKDSLAYFFGAAQFVPINALRSPMGGAIEAYTAAEKYCMDCTMRGIHQRPDFW